MRTLRPLLGGAAVATLVLAAGLTAPPVSDASSHHKDEKTADQAATVLSPDFVIGVRASASKPQVRVDVDNVRGRLVETLYDRGAAVGTHNVAWDTARLASGTYLYRLRVGGEVVATRQATVVR
jgi:hypothetical protein